MASSRPDFYQQLRRRIRTWMAGEGKTSKYAELVLLAPDLFHLMCKLVVDGRVPLSEKARLAAVIAYMVSPLDIIPELLLGPVAYFEDVALAAYVLNRIINVTSIEVVQSHWAGRADVLDVIRQVLKTANDLIGDRTWRRLRSIVDRAGFGK